MRSFRFLQRVVTMTGGGGAALTAQNSYPSRRYQGSLQSLLADKSDVYLPLVQELDLVGIARTLQQGSPKTFSTPLNTTAERMKQFNRRTLTDKGGPAEGAAAVLAAMAMEGWRNAEKEKAREEEAILAKLEKQRQEEASLSEESKAEINCQYTVQHYYDGLCALNSVLHMIMLEDGTNDPSNHNNNARDIINGTPLSEQLEQCVAAFEAVKSLQAELSQYDPKWWEREFLSEMEELRDILRDHYKVKGDFALP